MFKKLIALAFAVLSFAAQADYSLTVTNDGDGSVSGSDPSYTITGANNGELIDYLASLTSYTQTFAQAATITFSWTYTSYDTDGGNYDPAGYTLNGTQYQLSTSSLTGVSTSGTTTVSVAAGDTFGWYVDSVDSSAGAAVLAITVLAVPEPATYAMLLAGLGMIGFAARRRI
jgi:hypothetical protein